MPDKDNWNKTYLEVFEDYLPGIALAILCVLILLATMIYKSIPSSEEIEAARTQAIEREAEARKAAFR